VARGLRDAGRMNAERNATDNPPIDESTYGASSSESGGNYNQDGPTMANPEGDAMAEREEDGGESPDTPAA
jgi:hypothetical protein